MAYQYKILPTGKVDILENGSSISQGGPGYDLTYALKLGATPLNAANSANGAAPAPTPPPAPVASTGAPAAPLTTPTATTSPAATPSVSTPQGGFGLPPLQAPSNGGNTNTAFYQPPSGSGASSLTSFSDALDKAVSLAQQHRAQLTGPMMQGYQGTLMASDFGSILNNLGNASDSYSSRVSGAALKAATPQFTTQQIGQELYQMKYDANGQFLGAQKIADIPKDSKEFTYGTMTDNVGNIYQVQYDQSGKMIGQQLLSNAAPKSQNPVTLSPGETYYNPQSGSSFTNQTTNQQNGPKPVANTPAPTSQPPSTSIPSESVTSLKAALTASKFQGSEADGKYADLNLYLQNYQSWIAHGGSPEVFFKDFPPATYINPANTWLPPEIMKFVPQPKASTGGGIDFGSL